MTAAARLPDNAPFSADAIAVLNRVIAGSTAVQRSWLSGFLAGIEAANPAAATAAPPAVKQPLTILFATESGNSEALAAKTKKDAARLGFAPRVLDAANASPADLAGAKNLVAIVSTWGEGEPPQRATSLYAALMADDAPRFEGTRFAVLALGDRSYAKFCETGHRLDERLAALGGTRAAALLECDLDYDKPAAAWLGTTLTELRGKDEAAQVSGQDPGQDSVIHVDFGQAGVAEHDKSNPFEAEITELVNLNGSRSAKQTFHVELDLTESGITYQPGDALGIVPVNDPAVVEAVLAPVGLGGDAALHQALAERHDVTTLTGHLVRSYAELTGDASLTSLANDANRLAEFLPGRHVADLFESYPNRLTPEQLAGLLRPLPPRLYSIASSQASNPDEVHALIGAVRYQTHDRERGGVASTYVADRRRVGDRLRVYVKPNQHFRLPADPATPLIMIGPGTGVAPFRAFMQDRDAAGITGARTWLFFGDRTYTHDFLYQLEWQDLLHRGVLGRIDLAFSRDQDAKVYVQHRLWEQRRDVYAWLQDGARIYVCGDQAHMAKDVHAALRNVIADGAGVTPEAAEAELDAMKRQGRYLLDVY